MDGYLIQKIDEFANSYNKISELSGSYGSFLRNDFFKFILQNKPLKDIFDSRVFYFKSLEKNRDFQQIEIELIELSIKSFTAISSIPNITSVFSEAPYRTLVPFEQDIKHEELIKYYQEFQNYKTLGNDNLIVNNVDDLSEFYPTYNLSRQFIIIKRLLVYAINSVGEKSLEGTRLNKIYKLYDKALAAYLEPLINLPTKLQVSAFEKLLLWLIDKHFYREYLDLIPEDYIHKKNRPYTKNVVDMWFNSVVMGLKDELQNTETIQDEKSVYELSYAGQKLILNGTWIVKSYSGAIGFYDDLAALLADQKNQTDTYTVQQITKRIGKPNYNLSKVINMLGFKEELRKVFFPKTGYQSFTFRKSLEAKNFKSEGINSTKLGLEIAKLQRI